MYPTDVEETLWQVIKKMLNLQERKRKDDLREIWNAIFVLFAGKSYAIFALLFGFTFYIQSNNQKKQGKVINFPCKVVGVEKECLYLS